MINHFENQLNIALFCGGRGCATIIHELLRWPNVRLSLLVNAYDDGLSTGTLRQYIAEMLGPSDFRKNLSYLLSPHSESQYAIKTLLEFRFSKHDCKKEIVELQAFAALKQFSTLSEPFKTLFQHIEKAKLRDILKLLRHFFKFAESSPFDYHDCSLGNLIFAGSFLYNQHDFNRAAKEISRLVESRAELINISQGEPRILMALKENGELLSTEAEIVNPQSESPIHALFFMESPLEDWDKFQNKPLAEKVEKLGLLEKCPNISSEAEIALKKADIILYGPGTQHSSLFPSYRIANIHLQEACAPIKLLVMNLAPDFDIQSLSAKRVLDLALKYAGDPENKQQTITHVLLDSQCTLKKPLPKQKNCQILLGDWANPYTKEVHNGLAVVEKLWSLWESRLQNKEITLFIDLHQRQSALEELYEELSEIDWKPHFKTVNLTFQGATHLPFPKAPFTIKTRHLPHHFPEVFYFFEWLQNDSSEYLMFISSDGKYYFRDVMLSIKILEQSHFGAVFGSRTQSRRQFQSSLLAAYGEKKFLQFFSFLGAFLVSAIMALRHGIIFSDPLTGFRLFKRSRLHALGDKKATMITTWIGLTHFLIQHQIEIAEIPVNYKTFVGFVDPHWRFKRGLKNLFSSIWYRT